MSGEKARPIIVATLRCQMCGCDHTKLTSNIPERHRHKVGAIFPIEECPNCRNKRIHEVVALREVEP